MTKIIFTIILTASYITATAQIEKMDTDRPGQTNSPSTVPKKWIQSEIGFLKQTEKQDAVVFYQHPLLLTKYGLSKCFELRLITEVETIKEKNFNGYTVFTGLTSVQLGGKFNFLKEKGLRPKTSLIAHYDFARLRKPLYYDTIDGANFRFAIQHTISEKISLGYNIGMAWRSFRNSANFIYTLSPAFNINERWKAFIEVFGFIWNDRPPQNSVDAGTSFYVNDNFKLDASAGFGLNNQAPDNSFSIGASFRFKTTNK